MDEGCNFLSLLTTQINGGEQYFFCGAVYYPTSENCPFFEFSPSRNFRKFVSFVLCHFFLSIRNHAQAKKEDFLRKVFQAWLRFTKEILQREMQQFATSLSGLDSSFGSFAPSTFRNTLGSTLGSTFGSTLGSPSPTMSDVLTSSGYGASIRRGSGSVFTFGLPPKERDDDVS